VETMISTDGVAIERGNPGDRVSWILDQPNESFAVNAMFRRKKRSA